METSGLFKLIEVANTIIIKDKNEAEKALIELSQSQEIAIIIVSERAANESSVLIENITKERIFQS